MTETMLGILFMVVGLVAWAAIHRRTADLLHPLGLLLLFWFVVFGFAHWSVAATYDEPYYALPFELRTYAVVVGSALAFAFGFWLVDPDLPRLDRPSLAARLRGSLRIGPLRALTVVLFAVATATTAYFVYLLNGEIPLLSPRVDELRRVWKRPLWGYLYDLHYVVALFGTVLADRARSRRERGLWVGVVFAAILQLALGAVRLSPLTALVWSAVYVFYRGAGRLGMRHIVVVATLVLGLSTVIEYYRRAPIRLDPSLANPRLDLSLPATVWGHTGASFKNLQLSLERHVPFLGMGATSFDVAKTVDPELRARDEAISYRYGVHNTTTYLVPLYLDFGALGLIVMPGFFGVATAFVYRRFRERLSIFWLIVYIDFFLAVVLAFRTQRFFGNTLIYFGGVAFLAQLLAGEDVEEAERVGWAESGVEPGPEGWGMVAGGPRTA